MRGLKMIYIYDIGHNMYIPLDRVSRRVYPRQPSVTLFLINLFEISKWRKIIIVYSIYAVMTFFLQFIPFTIVLLKYKFKCLFSFFSIHER